MDIEVMVKRCLISAVATLIFSCSSDSTSPTEEIAVEDVSEARDDGLPDETALDTVSEDATWVTYFEPGVEKRGPFYVLRLKGSFYEMGRQHATLMRDALVEGVSYIQDSELGLLEPMMNATGFLDEAFAQSYDSVLEECRGMSDVLSEDGWTMERCIALAYGDVFLEHLKNGVIGCSQFVVTGKATPSGTMVHGRNMDWDKIDYLLKYPTVIVRHPEGRIPYAVVGFPGCVAPYNGLNAAGLSIASNEANSDNDIDRVGRSHVQMIAEILGTATTVKEAKSFLEAQDHMTAEILVISDGVEANVFEMTASHMAFRSLDENGIVYATNHFVSDTMKPYHIPYSPDKSSMTRYKRLGELLLPGGPDSLFGKLDVDHAIEVLRDHHNSYTGEDIPADLFDGGGTIANNGNIWSIVFVPERREFYAAAGSVPIPMNPYYGFSLDELLGVPGANPILEPKGVKLSFSF